MKHTIESTAAGLRVTAQVAPDKQAALLAELNKCAEGTCSCPSPQYAKLQGVAVQARPGQVTVDLTVKPGEVVDPDEISRCLDHTASQVGA